MNADASSSTIELRPSEALPIGPIPAWDGRVRLSPRATQTLMRITTFLVHLRELAAELLDSEEGLWIRQKLARAGEVALPLLGMTAVLGGTVAMHQIVGPTLGLPRFFGHLALFATVLLGVTAITTMRKNPSEPSAVVLLSAVLAQGALGMGLVVATGTDSALVGLAAAAATWFLSSVDSVTKPRAG